MNQQPRYIKMTCCNCKEHTVYVRQIYNPHISDWELCEAPICNECSIKESVNENRQHLGNVDSIHIDTNRRGYMMFVIGEGDKENVIVKITSAVGKSDQLIFLLGIILQIEEKYMDLFSMPSESLNDFSKSMERLAVNNVDIEGTQRETHYKRKINSRTKIRTWHQAKNKLKHKPYELRIYNKLLIVLSTKIFLTILA